MDEVESRHSVKVLRLQNGTRVNLTDGRGGWYEATIIDANLRKCLIRIDTYTPEFQPLPYHLHIAISPVKSIERFEWFLEKSTEIGISAITPLICHRTERKYLKHDRMERIIISALKQSFKAYKPVLNRPVLFGEFLESNRSGTLGIAHCYPSNRVSINEMQLSGDMTFLIGPEGDFTTEEVERANSVGYNPFHMGESRLRTETAGLFLCSAIRILNK